MNKNGSGSVISLIMQFFLLLLQSFLLMSCAYKCISPRIGKMMVQSIMGFVTLSDYDRLFVISVLRFMIHMPWLKFFLIRLCTNIYVFNVLVHIWLWQVQPLFFSLNTGMLESS